MEKNEEEAISQFEKSAAQGDHRSLNALGWYALEKKHDPAKALELFKASEKQGNPDAAFNLGHMYLHGRTPDGTKDRVCIHLSGPMNYCIGCKCNIKRTRTCALLLSSSEILHRFACRQICTNTLSLSVISIVIKVVIYSDWFICLEKHSLLV